MEELRPQTVRRPQTLRWIIVLAVAFAFFLTVAIAGRASATNPIVMFINLPAALALAWFGYAMATAKASSVTFDGETLTDDAGVVICALEDIHSVERGFALFKPSGGFALLLKEEKPRAWSPGLWWRIGQRVGIGGATPGRSSRNMADAITIAMAMRDAGEAPKASGAPKRPKRTGWRR
ncbi:MAG: hypothetical protein AAFN79_02110 [Pseudomonadota bacterium]